MHVLFIDLYIVSNTSIIEYEKKKKTCEEKYMVVMYEGYIDWVLGW